MKKNNIYLGLVHYPVYNKNGKIVCTSITNLDIHDISRTARTFGIKKFFIINPQKSQKKIYLRLKNFWETDTAKDYNPARFNSFEIIAYLPTIEKSKLYIKEKENAPPLTITTSAKTFPDSLSYEKTKTILSSTKPALFLFGTAHGLSDQVIENSDYHLHGIQEKFGYNHLSVRSAIAITLDRLLANYK